MTESTPDHRNAWIDATRGLAAVGVAWFHLTVIQTSGPENWLEFWRYGHLGVPVFFVLSGWCIAASWQRAPSAADFALRRARRILPAYYASLALVVALATFTKFAYGANDISPLPRTPGALVATLTLTTFPVTSVPSVNWVYWSLSYEVAFYLLLATLLFLPNRFRFVGLALLHLLLCVAAVLFRPPAHGPFFFVGLWPLFGLGAALVLLPVARQLSLAMLAANAAHAVVTFHRAEIVDYLTVALLTALWLVIGSRIPFPRVFEPLRQLGGFSYSLYLVHVPLGIGLLGRFFPQHLASAPACLAVYVGWLAVVIALAWGFHRCFERPFLRPTAPRVRTVAPLPA